MEAQARLMPGKAPQKHTMLHELWRSTTSGGKSFITGDSERSCPGHCTQASSPDCQHVACMEVNAPHPAKPSEPAHANTTTHKRLARWISPLQSNKHQFYTASHVILACPEKWPILSGRLSRSVTSLALSVFGVAVGGLARSHGKTTGDLG